MERRCGALELPALLLSAGAWLLSLATTVMSTWLTLSTELLPTESLALGLWDTCVLQEHGARLCRRYSSLLALPPDVQLARALMCASLAAGLLALLLAVPGMRAVNSCRGPRAPRCKRAMKLGAGALSLAAGLLGLVPVSYVAHLAVLRFFDESLPDVVPRWEFGDALFCGWAAGVLHLVAGTLLLASCLFVQNVPRAPGPESIRTRSEYV